MEASNQLGAFARKMVPAIESLVILRITNETVFWKSNTIHARTSWHYRGKKLVEKRVAIAARAGETGNFSESEVIKLFYRLIVSRVQKKKRKRYTEKKDI